MALRLQELASSSESSNSNSNSTPRRSYHVFLSFNGEDTRKGFAANLYYALESKGLKTFLEDFEVGRGEVTSLKLYEVIKESLSAIVILSENYASSPWCLDKLQKILDSRNKSGLEVFPIFYGVDPFDLRHQKGFAEAFRKHEEIFREDQQKVQKWRDCLTEVAKIPGWHCSDQMHEPKLIENVIKDLWSKLRFKLSCFIDTLVGSDKRLCKIDLLLEIGLDDVRFVGIWGMGGIGKTILARIVYETFLSHFEICWFLANVREVSNEKNGQVHLQRKLLSYLMVNGTEIEDTYQGRRMIKNLCCNKKILLILDDVNSINQLKNLAGNKDWFGAGSRVIITSRDMHLLIAHGVDKVYGVERMNHHESLQLFCNKAFKRDQPKDGYWELSKSVVEYARGLPLALEVLGSFLGDRSVPEWKETLHKLKKAEANNLFTSEILHDILQESNNTGGHSRLWSPENIDRVLKRHMPLWWKFMGLVSSVVGLLCYALGSSFKHLFGEWNLLKIFAYAVLSVIIISIMLFANKRRVPRKFLLKAHVGFLVLMLTSLYSFFSDKASNGKSDVLSLVSTGTFAIMSLSFSRQIDFGFEAGVFSFFLGSLTLQLMKIHLFLFLVAAVVCYSLIVLRSYLDSHTEIESIRNQDHRVLDIAGSSGL